MVAHFLKKNKPKSKVLILDRKDKFSKQGLFMEGWKNVYGDMIEWVAASKGGKVEGIDAANMVVNTEFDDHKGAVINFIPNQTAGKIAHDIGLTDAKGWCPVDLYTFESKQIPGIHVIGDAATVPGMPKSGNAANTEAKACAFAVTELLNGAESVEAPSTSNTCWSLVSPNYGIHVAAIWEATPTKYSKISGGVSGKGLSPATRKIEAGYAHGWYANIVKDIWNADT